MEMVMSLRLKSEGLGRSLQFCGNVGVNSIHQGRYESFGIGMRKGNGDGNILLIALMLSYS